MKILDLINMKCFLMITKQNNQQQDITDIRDRDSIDHLLTMVDQEISDSIISIMHDDLLEIREKAGFEGGRLMAIKKLRQVTGWSLTICKNKVDELT